MVKKWCHPYLPCEKGTLLGKHGPIPKCSSCGRVREASPTSSTASTFALEGRPFNACGPRWEGLPFYRHVRGDRSHRPPGPHLLLCGCGRQRRSRLPLWHAWSMGKLVTVEFKEDGEMTEMRMGMVSSGSPEGTAREMARAGWNKSFDKLEEYLEKGSVSVPRTN